MSGSRGQLSSADARALDQQTYEAIAERKHMRSLLRQSRELLKKVNRAGLHSQIRRSHVADGRVSQCNKRSCPSRACAPFHAATGRSVNRLVCLRRFQYAIASMATQHMALIAKQAASPQSDRLMSA
jgi:hypothetical protein